MNRAEMSLAARHAGPTHRANFVLIPARSSAREHELDERVPRELLQLAQERATARVAIAFDRGLRLGFETRELASQKPIGQGDPTRRKAEANALAIGQAARVVGTDGGRDLRLRLL